MKKREGQWQNETMHSSSGAPKPKDKNEWNEDATESRPAGAATAVVADDAQVLVQLLQRWQQDPTATYHTWFRWEERIKNFRSIRRGLQAVVQERSEEHTSELQSLMRISYAVFCLKK